jgi:serine protease
MHRMKRVLLPTLIAVCCALAWGCGGDGGDPGPFTLSGTIYSAAGNAVAMQTNGTLESAQAIAPPVILGGHLTEPGQHVFAARLPAHALIRLALPDHTAPVSAVVELDLYDQENTQEPVASLPNVARTAALVTEVGGDYYIVVRAVSGQTIYRLIVDRPPAMVSGAGLGGQAEFVPGEVLVKLDAAATPPTARAMSGFARDAGLRMVRGSRDGWMRLRAEDMQAAFERLGVAPRRTPGQDRRSPAQSRRQEQQDTLRLVRVLQARPGVRHAQPNYIYRTFFEPNDPLYPLQWHYELINLPAAWAHTRGDASVVVAVIDTGVLADHPDLQGKLTAGYDFVDMDDNPEDPGGGTGFHGTHVAGTVAAAFDNALGVAGVGGATMIMPVRALGDGGGEDWDIVMAVRWAAGLDVFDEDDNLIFKGANPRADIINMSFGGPGNSEALRNAIQEAREAGVILIAAAGNSASADLIYPAAFEEVISVSAVDAYARLAYYSSFGPTIALAAPGGNLNTDSQPDSYADGVLSTWARSAGGTIVPGYGYSQGTSMAAPHVAGVAALMKAVRPGMTPDELHGFITSGAMTADLGPAGRDDLFGDGLIDAHAAVVAAAETDPPAHLTVTPADLRFGPDDMTAELFLRPMGVDPLELDFIDTPDWLTVSRNANQETGEFGCYRVTVVRTALHGGIQTGIIKFGSSANTVTVPVTVDVLPDPGASAGTQYVLLLNADTRERVAVREVSPQQGRYDFTFTGVPAGAYHLRASSDLNRNYVVFDPGEAVGGYPSLENLQAIQVQSDVTGLTFVTGFNQWPFIWPADAPLDALRLP